MTLNRRSMMTLATAFFAAGGGHTAFAEGDDIKKLAIQISDNEKGTFQKALNVAANFARAMSEAGEMYEIEIVAFNAGLHILREDTSPVRERINSFSQSMPEVTFSACNNTITGMTKKEGKAPPITSHAQVVPGGVTRLMELDAMGYFVIRP
jgi:intracellular sulfur oxidation DsrE/DsrF family protein